jgi:hypothetical protein
MIESAGYPFCWFCVDNGSKDQTKEWLTELTKKGKVKTKSLAKSLSLISSW